MRARLDECAPFLVGLLAEANESQERFDAREGPSSFALIYALDLLARHRNEAAHEPLIELVRATGDFFLGDAVTEGLGSWLFATSGGRTDAIERLVLDRDVDPWVRTAGVRARAMLGDSDPGLRDEAVAFLRSVLTDGDDPDSEPVRTSAAGALLDLGHEDSGDLLRDAIERGRVDPWALSVGDLIDRGPRTAAEAGAYLARELERYLPPDDPHRSLAHWAAFEENRTRFRPHLALRPGGSRKGVAQKLAVKKKSRRKAEKKARRKQRSRR